MEFLEYCGPIREWRGKAAVVRPAKDDRFVIAQFGDIKHPFSHGWATFPKGDFTTVSYQQSGDFVQRLKYIRAIREKGGMSPLEAIIHSKKMVRLYKGCYMTFDDTVEHEFEYGVNSIQVTKQRAMRYTLSYTWYRLQCVFWFMRFTETSFRDAWEYSFNMYHWKMDDISPREAVREEISYWDEPV